MGALSTTRTVSG